MSEFIIGIISGVVSSLIFGVILLFVRPKIFVSERICSANEDGVLFYRIKVVNKTHTMLTGVKYVLYYCEDQGDSV